jgi:hypothetical protein
LYGPSLLFSQASCSFCFPVEIARKGGAKLIEMAKSGERGRFNKGNYQSRRIPCREVARTRKTLRRQATVGHVVDNIFSAEVEAGVISWLDVDRGCLLRHRREVWAAGKQTDDYAKRNEAAEFRSDLQIILLRLPVLYASSIIALRADVSSLPNALPRRIVENWTRIATFKRHCRLKRVISFILLLQINIIMLAN